MPDDALLQRIENVFVECFGRTPLDQRCEDILKQAQQLSRYTDARHLRETAGNLLCSTLQLLNECDWPMEGVIQEALARIEDRREVYGQMGRRIKVGILGGAFDPIHLGHVEIAKIVLASGVVDEVWWMPCHQHLAGKNMVSSADRLEMCRLAAQQVRGVKVCDYEVRHQFRGETFHLVKKLLEDRELQRTYELSLIFGRDNADSMHAWANADHLQRLIPLLIVPRGGLPEPAAGVWYCQSPHRYLSSAATFEASSTDVRRLIMNNDPEVKQLLPEAVHAYIQAKGFYRATETRLPAQPILNRRVAIMRGSFDPPTSGQVELAQNLLSSGFEAVVVCPISKQQLSGRVEHAEPVHRAAMVDLAFGGRPRIHVDLSALDEDRGLAPTAVAKKFGQDREVWHVVTPETVAGRESPADLRNAWENGDLLWQECGFVIVSSEDTQLRPETLPPKSQWCKLRNYRRPADLRQRFWSGESIQGMLPASVETYARRHRLFQPGHLRGARTINLESPRVTLVYDQRNPQAVALAERYRRWEQPDPDLIVVLGGDGTMLHAIREHWRMRRPFLGINSGHLGFLMNQQRFESLNGLELVAYRMPMLRVNVDSKERGLEQHLAFSDAWLERMGGQAAWMELEVDGQVRIRKLVGDGLLVATPSGSSAYARAMGASPVPLDAPTLTIAGSNIFRPRFWRPLAVPTSTAIQVRTLDHTGKRPVAGYVDGLPLGQVHSLGIARSNVASVELVFTRQSDLSTKLLTSLLPKEDDDY